MLEQAKQPEKSLTVAMAPSQPRMHGVGIIGELRLPERIKSPRANNPSLHAPKPSNSDSNDQKRRERKQSNNHVADADLASCIYKGPLEKVVRDHKYMFVSPLYWTHRHEKVLHVVWQSFQPPPYQISQSYLLCGRPPCDRHQGPSAFQKLKWNEEKLLWRIRSATGERQRWLRRLRHAEQWETKEKEDPNFSSRPILPSLPFSFELINEDERKVTNSIVSLQKRDGFVRHGRQREAMKILLSGVDQEDTLRVLGRLSPSQKFIRVEKESVKLAYGRFTFPFLSKVPVYRMDTVPSKTNDGNIDDHHQGSAAPDTEGFWRMIHLDYAHIFDGLDVYRKRGRNFKVYGIRQGMTKHEYMDRFEFEYGEGEWNQPHFIPGVFIAMAQRYRRKEWIGQGDMGDDATPTWQILLTDGPNDRYHAHLYTTQVPNFLLSSFDKPAEMHLPLPPASTQKETTIDNECKNEEELKEVPLDFPIRHTIITYYPKDTFRERLRELIMLSRDSFRNTGEHAQRPSQDEDTQPDTQPTDIDG